MQIREAYLIRILRTAYFIGKNDAWESTFEDWKDVVIKKLNKKR